MILFSCRKESLAPPTESCLTQTGNPDHLSYSGSDILSVRYSAKHCGLLPLSTKNYWIYLDSVYADGEFLKTEMDTLQFSQTFQTQSDGLIWWKASKEMGLPATCYSNDSAIFGLNERLFSSSPVFDVKKEIYFAAVDSIRFLTSFNDEAAIGTEKKNSSIATSLGTFSDCIFVEKFAPTYRRDQSYFEPGIGIIKYVFQKAAAGDYIIKTQRISTLVKYHID
jgi:hypothetical protein